MSTWGGIGSARWVRAPSQRTRRLQRAQAFCAKARENEMMPLGPMLLERTSKISKSFIAPSSAATARAAIPASPTRLDPKYSSCRFESAPSDMALARAVHPVDPIEFAHRSSFSSAERHVAPAHARERTLRPSSPSVLCCSHSSLSGASSIRSSVRGSITSSGSPTLAARPSPLHTAWQMTLITWLVILFFEISAICVPRRKCARSTVSGALSTGCP
eukprot:5616662-Prymnesium_polylepis.2